MHKDDITRMSHMLEAANELAAFVSGRTRADLESDRMLLFAVVRAIEIMGEAASKVSDEARALTAEIPWKALVNMRNRMIHAYFDVDKDIVWNAVADEMPKLLTDLQAALRLLQSDC
jgi:uncharacterized protein with HEPN domain